MSFKWNIATIVIVTSVITYNAPGFIFDYYKKNFLPGRVLEVKLKDPNVMTISARSSHVVIKNITLNRGNCQVDYDFDNNPIRINYGDIASLNIHSTTPERTCNLYSIVLNTDYGVLTIGDK